MTKKILPAALLAALLTFSCAGIGRPTDGRDFWITTPGAGDLTIVGVSGPQLWASRVTDNAREHAARNASMFHRVEARFFVRQAVGASIFHFENFSEYTITYDRNLEPFMERLSHDPDRDVLRAGNATGIRFSYPASLPAPVSFSTARNPDGSPSWTTMPPVISGYLVGVGHAGRRLRVGDAFASSTNAAIASIVSQIWISSTGRYVQVNSMVATVHTQERRGSITNFFVLETWVDPVSQSVWTLAIARPAN
ncbi:MAG: LPP20 family lipoprotein [Spirochaetes bacterium]|nr:LPP20 family lipoprotein [Spirochaetota bacterium]